MARWTTRLLRTCGVSTMTMDDYEQYAVDLANISRKMMDCAPDYAAAQKKLIKEARANIEKIMEKIEVDA